MGLVMKTSLVDNREEVLQASKEQIYAWLEAIGEDAAQTSGNFAPVDTGRLKGSISSVVDEQNTCVYIGTNVEYAPYQEFGTSRGVKGKHFIQFGCTAHTDQYKALLEEYLKG